MGDCYFVLAHLYHQKTGDQVVIGIDGTKNVFGMQCQFLSLDMAPPEFADDFRALVREIHARAIIFAPPEDLVRGWD